MPDTDATYSEQDELQDGTGQVDYVTNSPALGSLFSACGWNVKVIESTNELTTTFHNIRFKRLEGFRDLAAYEAAHFKETK